MNHNPYTAVCFGEVLWDILPDARLPGGAPMNVAYHLNQLQVSTAMISRVGRDDPGDEILRFIASKGVATAFIQKDDHHPTGTVLATVNNNDVSYEIIEPVAWDFIHNNMQLQELLPAVHYFIFGSLGARNEKSRQTLFELLEIAPFKILDINLRKPHYEKKVLEYLMQHTDMLKLNHQELELISAWFGFAGDAQEQMRALQEKFHLDTVLVTRGERGAAVLQNGAWYEHDGFKVKVADTIGSGDAFLAGFLSRFIQSSPPAESLDFACKMGAFIASQPGACPSYTVADVDKITKGN